MLGYYNNPDATEEVLRDGWLYTGDYGRIDKDGFLYITGRKKNVIVTKNGKNIYPEDIELYLNSSEYIKESLVYGVASEEDEETKVCAQIVPNMEVIVEELGSFPLKEELDKINAAKVKKANKKLSNYKKIRHFDIREEEFEKPPTKKINRYVELLTVNISSLAKKLLFGDKTMLSTYHTHSLFCDGKLMPEDYILAAISKGFTAIGISSHAPVCFETDWTMKPEKMDEYLYSVLALKEKYRGKLQIYAGLETDYYPGCRDYRKYPGLDYTIGSVHFIHHQQSNQYMALDGTHDEFIKTRVIVFDGEVRCLIEKF